MVRRLAQALLAITGMALVAFAWRCDGRWFDLHVFLPQQFFIRASPVLASVARVLAGGVGALLLVCVPLVPKGAAGRRLALAVLLAIAASDVLLRWRLRQIVHPELSREMQALTGHDPRYGWSFTPLLDRLVPISGRQIRFRTDGERRRIPGGAVDAAAPSIVFTGESTVAGMGLQWDETFPALLASRLHLQAVDLASPAYRLDQSWLRLKDELPRLQRPIAVVGLFMPGLIGRSFAGTTRPHAYESSSGGIVLGPEEERGALQRSGLYQLWHHLYWSGAHLQEGTRSVAALLRDMSALARARGIPCVFLVTGDTPAWMVRELFDAQKLDYVVADVPEEELLDDGHPGPRGSIRLADALEGRLRTKIADR